MRYYGPKPDSIAPEQLIKSFILIHIGIIVLSMITSPLFQNLGGLTIPSLLALSSWGLDHFFYWQIISHVFCPPLREFSFSFILDQTFTLYFLWTAALAIAQNRKNKDFIILYFLGALSSGLAAIVYKKLTGTLPPIAGLTPSLYALLAAWIFLQANTQVLLFFTIPIKIQWLIGGILISTFLVDFSNGNYLNLMMYGSSIFVGYFYALLVWQILSPFRTLHSFERIFISLSRMIQSLFSRKQFKNNKRFQSQKIYDFYEGKRLLENETFMNSCLEKIQKEGKSSLNFFENWKLKRISKKMKRKLDD